MRAKVEGRAGRVGEEEGTRGGSVGTEGGRKEGEGRDGNGQRWKNVRSATGGTAWSCLCFSSHCVAWCFECIPGFIFASEPWTVFGHVILHTLRICEMMTLGIGLSMEFSLQAKHNRFCTGLL